VARARELGAASASFITADMGDHSRWLDTCLSASSVAPVGSLPRLYAGAGLQSAPGVDTSAPGRARKPVDAADHRTASPYREVLEYI
jgi:hypothetical protein